MNAINNAMVKSYPKYNNEKKVIDEINCNTTNEKQINGILIWRGISIVYFLRASAQL